ncbi:MAG: hypothetical protein ABL955_16495 [Elusimicrobiota bacterium]
MDAEFFVPFVFFGFLGAIILVPIWLREKTRQSAHQIISQALERGQTLDVSVVRELTQMGRPQPQERGRRTLGLGIVLLGIAGGFAAGGWALAGLAQEALFGMLVPAAFLAALGIAFTLLGIVDLAAKKKEG